MRVDFPPRSGRGFTLVELLVVMAIVALLLSLSLPAMSGARDSAKQVRALSDLRQLGAAETTYRYDHYGRVMLGVPPASIDGQPTLARTASGHTVSHLIAKRYPWRLSPYFDNVWGSVYGHEPPPTPPTRGDTQAQAFLKAYYLSLSPSYGYNAVYLGGHADFDGFHPGSGRPRTGAHVAFHEADIRRPTQLITFTETQARGPGFEPEQQTGYYAVTPPRADGQRWTATGNELVSTANPTQQNPMPVGRFGPGTGTVFFDGHAGVLLPNELDDMRRWSHWAQTPDADYASP